MAKAHASTPPSSRKVCSVDGCERTPRCKGMCTIHHDRLRKSGHTELQNHRQPPNCTIEGCKRKPVTRGFCATHYARWLRHGDPLYINPNKRPAGSGYVNAAGYLERCENGIQMREHRRIVSKILGRPLRPDEHVHHKDHNPLNNSPENLEILSPSAHSKLHARPKLPYDEWTYECAGCRRIQPRSMFAANKHVYCHECDNTRHRWRHRFKGHRL